MGQYVGVLCKHHPELGGARLESNKRCVKCHADRVKEYKIRKADEQREYQRKYSAEYNRKGSPGYERVLQRNTEKRHRDKAKVFDHYGRACSCGFDDMRALTIDHVDQMGTAHRRPNGERYLGHKLYRWLVVNGFPEGFRTLCRNCQSIAHAEFDGRNENGNGGSQSKRGTFWM